MRALLASILAALTVATAASAQAQSAPVPVAPLHTFITPDDYPEDALQKGEQGSARIRLEVASNGAVSNCSILTSSGSASLDAKTCEVVTAKARFTPAKDTSGQAISGMFETSIRWVLQDGMGSPRLNTATQLWIHCINGNAANSVGSELTPDAIATQSFASCADAERLLEKEMKRAELPGMVPSTAIAGLKRQFRPKIIASITEARKLLQN